MPCVSARLWDPWSYNLMMFWWASLILSPGNTTPWHFIIALKRCSWTQIFAESRDNCLCVRVTVSGEKRLSSHDDKISSHCPHCDDQTDPSVKMTNYDVVWSFPGFQAALPPRWSSFHPLATFPGAEDHHLVVQSSCERENDEKV